MTTTSLPARLRAVAAFIEKHALPEPDVTMHPSGYTHLHAANLSEVRAWAVALNRPVTEQYVPCSSDTGLPFVSHRVAGLVGDLALAVSFYDHDQARVARYAPQAVTA